MLSTSSMDAGRTSESDVKSQRRWSGTAAAAAVAPATLLAGVAADEAVVAGVAASALLRTLEALLLVVVDAIVPSEVDGCIVRAASAPSAPAAPLVEADEADLMLALPASEVAPSAGDETTDGRRESLVVGAGVVEDEEADGAGGARTNAV